MENAKFIPKVQSNCNIHHFDNVINDDITDFDSIINHMLPSLNDNYYQDNYEQFMLDRADDDVFDPMLLFCNEISENHFAPLIEQEYSEIKPLVQVNDNSDNNNVTIVVHKDVDVPEQEFGSDRLDEKLQEEEFELEEPIPLQVWNDYLVYDNIIPCSQCQVLRQIMHTNGTQSTKLEIHGGVGVISHAILVNHRNSNDDETTPGIQDYQMIDFSNISAKEYIEKYLEERQQNGYILLRDPLSSFYEALCIGYDWLSPNNFFTPHDAPTKTSVGEQSVVQKDHGETSYQVKDDSRKRHHHHHHHRYDVKVTHNAKDKLAEANKQAPKMPRMELSVQRERTKNMVIEEFAQYFDLPLEHAIKKLRLCDTVVKKKLRSFGVPRWPYRKVKSIKRRISELSRDLEVQNPELRMNIVIEIQKLQQLVDGILSGNIDIIRDVLV